MLGHDYEYEIRMKPSPVQYEFVVGYLLES